MLLVLVAPTAAQVGRINAFANPFHDKTHADIAIIMSLVVEKADASSQTHGKARPESGARGRTAPQGSIDNK